MDDGAVPLLEALADYCAPAPGRARSGAPDRLPRGRKRPARRHEWYPAARLTAGPTPGPRLWSVIAKGRDELLLGHRGAAPDPDFPGTLDQVLLRPVLIAGAVPAAGCDLAARAACGRVRDPR